MPQQFQFWCSKNRLVSNIGKTELIAFNAKTCPSFDIPLTSSYTISCSPSIKYLGTYFDFNLSCDSQTDYICKKLNSAFFAIKQLKTRISREYLITIYHSLVVSHLNFNTLAWGFSSMKNSDRILISQKRILRMMFNIPPLQSCKDTFKNNNFLTFPGIFIYKCMTYVSDSTLRGTICVHVKNIDYLKTTNEYNNE